MEDLNRIVLQWHADAPCGASVWPYMAGLLSSRGASRHAFDSNYFCPHVIVKGSGKLKTSRGEWKLGPGDMFTLWPGESFDYFEDPGSFWEFHWIHLKGPGCAAFLAACGFSEGILSLRPAKPQEIERVFFEIWSAMSLKEHPSKTLSLLYSLPALCSSKPVEAVQPSGSALADEALKLMESMMHTGMNAKELAECCGVGRTTLFRAFRKRFGCAPAERLEFMRMAKAKDLLKNTARSIEAVAQAVGFHDARYFARRFKELEGFSPREFRKGGA